MKRLSARIRAVIAAAARLAAKRKRTRAERRKAYLSVYCKLYYLAKRSRS